MNHCCFSKYCKYTLNTSQQFELFLPHKTNPTVLSQLCHLLSVLHYTLGCLPSHNPREVVNKNVYVCLVCFCEFCSVCVCFLLVFLSSGCPTRGSLWAHYSLPAQLTCGKGEINSQFHFAASVWQVLDRSGLGACKEQERESALHWPPPPPFLSLTVSQCLARPSATTPGYVDTLNIIYSECGIWRMVVIRTRILYFIITVNAQRI